MGYDYLTRQGSGSTSKTVTAFAVLQALEAKGKDEKALLVDLLPKWWGIPKENHPLTVAMLLQHYAGLQSFGKDYKSLRRSMQTPTTGFGKVFYAYSNNN